MKTIHIFALLSAILLSGCASQPHTALTEPAATSPTVIVKRIQCVHVTVKVVGPHSEPLDGYKVKLDTVSNGNLADYQQLQHGQHIFKVGRYDDAGIVWLVGGAPSDNKPPKVGAICRKDVKNYSHNMVVQFTIPCQ